MSTVQADCLPLLRSMSASFWRSTFSKKENRNSNIWTIKQHEPRVVWTVMVTWNRQWTLKCKDFNDLTCFNTDNKQEVYFSVFSLKKKKKLRKEQKGSEHTPPTHKTLLGLWGCTQHDHHFLCEPASVMFVCVCGEQRSKASLKDLLSKSGRKLPLPLYRYVWTVINFSYQPHDVSIGCTPVVTVFLPPAVSLDCRTIFVNFF